MTGSQDRREHPRAVLTKAKIPASPVEPEVPDGADFLVMPRKRTRFAELSASGLEQVIEGVATDLDAVLDYIRGHGPDRNTGYDAYDLVVYRDQRVVAILTRGDDRWPLVRLVEPAVGPLAGPDDEEEGLADA